MPPETRLCLRRSCCPATLYSAEEGRAPAQLHGSHGCRPSRGLLSLAVSCTWDGTDALLKELRSAVMQKTCGRGFTLLRRLNDLTPEVSRLLGQGMQMHPARKYELVLFKNTAKPNGDVDPGDQSKTACQLCDAEDPSLQLLQLLIKLLLPGYKIGSKMC
jgi:hypothetical protein